MTLNAPFQAVVPIEPRLITRNLAPNSLTPGVPPANPTLNSSTAGDVYGTATIAGCNLITNPSLRAACIAATAYAGTRLGLTGQPAAPPTSPSAFCPPGYKRDAAGACVTTGIGAYLPGDVGAPDVVWSPVFGRHGAGVTPIAVQTSRRVCPPGYVVGNDGVCYEGLAKSKRMHNPGTRPFLTGGEVNAIRRAKRLEKRFNRLRSGKGALFPARTKSCATKRKKR